MSELFERIGEAWERLGWWLSENLPQPVVRAFERVRDGARWFGRGVQRVVVTVLLFLLYVLGIGMTRALTAVAARPYLKLYTLGPEQDSYWIDAEGYELDERRLHGQF